MTEDLVCIEEGRVLGVFVAFLCQKPVGGGEPPVRVPLNASLTTMTSSEF